jgi:hypothetical protein
MSLKTVFGKNFIFQRVACFSFNYKPSSDTDRNMQEKNTYIHHIIIKPTEVSNLKYLQNFVMG